ncbi:MAG: CHAT domain-containing protein [Bryobacterales bacterium]|nr:CHAT domain-containing protein [Bryobacterales bacterium]
MTRSFQQTHTPHPREQAVREFPSSMIFAFGLIYLVSSACSLIAADPAQLLAQAEQLADVYNWYDAHPIYAEAEAAFRRAGDERNALFARVSRLRGEMQVRSLSGLVEDIDALLATHVAKSDKRVQLRCLVVKGDVDLEIDAPAAKDDWEAALSLATEIGDRKWQSRAKGELGMIAFILGDARTALSQVSQALMTAGTTGDIGAEIRYYAAIATGLNLSGAYAQAIPYFDRALTTASKHPQTGFQYISIWGKAKALLGVGRIDEAEHLVQEGLRQAEADDRRVKKVQMLIAASDIAKTRGLSDRAVQYLTEALPIAEHGDFKRLLAAIYFNLTELGLQNQRIPDASRYAESALRLVDQIGDRYFLPSQLLVIAKVRKAEGKQIAALECLDRATDIVDGLLVNVGTPGRAAMLISQMSSIYAYQFELAAQDRSRVDYTFQVLERARGRVLSDVITLGKPFQSGPPSPERRSLEKNLSRLQRSLLTLNKRAERAATLRQIWEVEQKLARAEALSSRWAPRREQALTLRDFQQELLPAEATVEYVFTEDSLYALTLSRDSVSVTKLGRRDKIEGLIRSYQDTLQKQAATDDLVAPATQAHRALLAPLTGLTGKSRVVIVPDAVLNGVPFDILDSAGRAPNARMRIISFAPSATALHALRRNRIKAPIDLPLLAVGDVPYDSLEKRVPNPSRAAGVFDAKTKPELPPLPASRAEVESVARIFAPGSVELLGAKATESHLKAEPLNRFAIIHLAVHGFADPNEPQRAALMLAPDPSRDEDGFLQPREISELPIAAQLVVLSACGTGVGRSLGQEGIANLARAFLLAGASSVLTTLWTVGDTGSSALMVEFYRNLHAGLEVATALRDAKQTLLRRFGPAILPTVAAFQVVGNGSVTIQPQPNSTIRTAQP